ncbi:MAG: putative toxin-antitoxin system toxin component, PIN family [Thermodesulfovibrionales bacterium]|jgi:putative PIN family toxin of toxin-antitoxin system|nr:putative toxin-antitoxin system toxin component, PIN family [Thermodesulfovibrionales bacterium]
MGPVTKVVIDTNIFVSGFGWNGKPEEVLKLIKDRQIVNYSSAEIFEEISRVVSYPKLRFSEPLQIAILEFVLFYSEFVAPQKRIFTVTEDPDDNKFLECAMEAKADYIISGDPHLLDMKKSKTVKIVTASEFLDIISKK